MVEVNAEPIGCQVLIELNALFVFVLGLVAEGWYEGFENLRWPVTLEGKSH